VCVVAASGLTLACDRQASWIDAAHVCALGTAQPLGTPDPSTFTYSYLFICSV
jgi:hypothetical protein